MQQIWQLPNAWLEYKMDCNASNVPKKDVLDLLSFRHKIAIALTSVRKTVVQKKEEGLHQQKFANIKQTVINGMKSDRWMTSSLTPQTTFCCTMTKMNPQGARITTAGNSDPIGIVSSVKCTCSLQKTETVSSNFTSHISKQQD